MVSIGDKNIWAVLMDLVHDFKAVLIRMLFLVFLEIFSQVLDGDFLFFDIALVLILPVLNLPEGSLSLLLFQIQSITKNINQALTSFS